MPSKHPWQARLVIGLTMLLLAFLGMIVTDVRSTGGWNYWKWMVIVYGVLALWLSWYLRRDKKTISPITIWHELLHWAGLTLSVFMLSFFVHLGTISRFNAGLFDLVLLALAVFLAGIYIEVSFLFVGIILGVFALLIACVDQYLYVFLIPLLVIGSLLITWMVWRSHHKKTQL